MQYDILSIVVLFLLVFILAIQIQVSALSRKTEENEKNIRKIEEKEKNVRKIEEKEKGINKIEEKVVNMNKIEEKGGNINKQINEQLAERLKEKK